MPWVLQPWNSTPVWVDEEQNQGTANEYMNQSQVDKNGNISGSSGTVLPYGTTGTPASSVPWSAESYSTGSYMPDPTGVSSNWNDYLTMLKEISDQNNQFNLQQVKEVNAFNAKEALKNRQWQERMSRNAHQIEVKDLLKAGLNPVLSAGGQGAQVGSGGVASGQKAVADSIYGEGVQSFMTAAINAASAQNVARIYANSNMAQAAMSSSSRAQNQAQYLDVLKSNNSNSNWTKIITSMLYGASRMMQSVFYGTAAQQWHKRRSY